MRLKERQRGIDDVALMKLLSNYIPVGNTANMIHGYSNSSIRSILQLYTPMKELNNCTTLLRRFIYLPNYDMTRGIKNNYPTPERTICDFLMYPKELCSDLYLMDAIEGYKEEFGDFCKVYDMLKDFNIDKKDFDYWLDYLWEGSNSFAVEEVCWDD